MLCGGCVSLSVSVCPSPPFHPPPSPFPNLESDVAPSYSTFPRVSSGVANRLGALQARRPTPAVTARWAGQGGAGVPSRPLLLSPGGGAEARGGGLVLGQLAPPASRSKGPLPSRSANSGLGPDPGPREAPWLCGARAPFSVVTSGPLDH